MTVGSKVKQTLAELKGAYGTLQMYSAHTENEETKAAFVNAEEEIKQIIGDLEGRLQVLESQEPQYKGK